MNVKGIIRTAEGVRHYKQLRTIFRSLEAGSSIHQACKMAGVAVMTLWRWRQRRDKLDNLVNRTIESRIQLVEDAQYKSAVEGSPTAQIFFLTNRASGRWKRDTQVKVGVHVEQHNDRPLRGKSDEEIDELYSSIIKRG